MQHPPDPSGLTQTVGFQILSALRNIAGSIRIAMFQLATCLLLFFTYAVPDQAHDIFVDLTTGNTFQFIGLLLSLLLISYLNWYMVRFIFVKLSQYNRLPDYYSQRFYINIIEPTVTLLPFIAAAAGFYVAIKTSFPTKTISIVCGTGFIWYLILSALSKKGFTTPLKKLMQSSEPKIHGFKFYAFIVVVFLILFSTAVLIPQQVGWARLLGPIVIISLGFCFWSWIGSYIYLYSRIWYTPFIPIILTYVFFVAEPFNNNHSVRTVEYKTDERFTMHQYMKNWLVNHFETTKSDTALKNIYIISAEGGGIRSAYWTSGVLAKLERKSNFNFHNNIIALSGVSGGSVGLTFFINGINSLVYQDSLIQLEKKLAKTSSFDFLSDLNAGLIFNDVIQKLIPLPINSLDRARKLENAFCQSFENNFGPKINLSYGLCSEYAKPKHPFSPIIVLNTTHVESGRKAIISNCRLGPKNEYFYDVIDVLQKSKQDIYLASAASSSSRFPFVTPPALIEKEDKLSWGHVVDGGYFENSGLHSAWQLRMEFEIVVNEEINSTTNEAYKKYLQNTKLQVIYLKNSHTSDIEDEKPIKIEELAPASAFINAWSRKTVTDIKHFENNTSKNCFYIIKLKRADDDGIPLGWYLSVDARNKIQMQLNAIDTMRDVKLLYKNFNR